MLESLGPLAFAGTPEFAVPTLEALCRAGACVPLVLTQPDRPSGRGRRLTASPIKHAALQAGLHVAQPPSLRDAALLGELGSRPEYLIVVAYGLLLPDWMLAWPRRAAINVHASLLPRWRGAAPIQRAILAGDTETGVSIMRMEHGLDSGPVYTRASVQIGERTTAAELHDALATLGAATLVDTLPAIHRGELAAQPQDQTGVTYATKLEKGEAAIDWARAAVEIDRQIRAFVGWPVAEARLADGRRLRIWEAAPLARAGRHAAPGTILRASESGIEVATGAGLLRLTRVQAPSGRVIPAHAYLAAHPLEHTSFV